MTNFFIAHALFAPLWLPVIWLIVQGVFWIEDHK